MDTTVAQSNDCSSTVSALFKISCLLCLLWKWWDTLLMPEDVLRIHFGLNLYQPVEVVLEIPIAPGTFLNVACVVLGVYSQIKIPVIHILSSWETRHLSPHVVVKVPNPIYVLCNIFLSLLPNRENTSIIF